MTDALHPLRCAYGVEAPGEPPPGGPPPAGAAGHAEWRLLAQMRDLLERWPAPAPDASVIDAALGHAALGHAAVATEGARLDALRATLPSVPPVRPSPAVIAGIEAAAAAATLAAVRQVYDEPVDGPPIAASVAEVAVLAQSRDLLENAPRANGPSEPVLAAILARAEEASSVRTVADGAVTVPALAPVAAVYGLVAPAPADPVETALLLGARDAVSLLPRLRPETSAIAAVLARAAEASPVVASSSVTPRVAPARAADRAAVPGGAGASPRPARRTGLWAGSAALVGALVMALVLFPREGVDTTDAPSLVATADAGIAIAPLTAEVAPDAAGSVTPEPAIPIADDDALIAAATPPAPSTSRETARPDLPPRPSPAVARPRDARPAEASAFTPVAARVAAPSTAEPDAGWDASGDLRTLSMRLRTLRQTTAGTEWAAPAEAFGAPRTPVTMSATPGLRSVRAGTTPARARVRLDSVQTGD